MLLRYFESKFHAELLPEFKGRIREIWQNSMYRFRPDYEMYARPISEYPGNLYKHEIYYAHDSK